MQVYSYSPSVNIIRDKDRELNYVKTLNGQRAFEQIVSSANVGYRTFSIIGAYGTGKSTFLWALAHAVQNENKFFDHFDYFIKGYQKYTTLDFVGEYTSLQDIFAKKLNCESKDVLTSLKLYTESLKKEETALIIRIDEFGKFLEHAAQNNPEQSFYFIQELSEFVNDDSGNTIMLTTLHQDFSAYAYHLSEAQRKEWQKVKGRLQEIPFNVPSEQLLLIAAERLKDQINHNDNLQLLELTEVITKSNAFPSKEYFSLDVIKALYPLELLSGSILTMALQRYGQNDRSLFTFLDAEDYKGIRYFLKEENNTFYSLGDVYDYLIYHYSQQLLVKQNLDFQIWRLMHDSIEKAEGIFTGEQLIKCVSLIKVIGLLQLFSRKSMSINEEFLAGYSRIVLGYETILEELKRLANLSIIRYRDKSKKFVLVEETDVDIDWEIEHAKKFITEIRSIGSYLSDHIELPSLLAKRALLEKGTPRYFTFIFSDQALSLKPIGEIDGYINLVFSTNEIDNTRKLSGSQEEAILYVVYKKSKEILRNITLIEQIKYARAKYSDDNIAKKEFTIQLDQILELLKEMVLEALYRIDPNEISVFYRGIDCTEKIKTWRELNGLLSDIIDKTYFGAPVFKNEMVNKTKLSSPILTARKALFNNICDNMGREDFGFNPSLYPPEKTIYYSLLKSNGFYNKGEFGTYELNSPSSEDFRLVWGLFLEFLDEARVSKINLQELVERLLERPFKLKKGLIDFILPLFLLVKQSDFSLFNKDGFIPQLNANILDLIVKNPGEFSIKSFSATGIHLSVFNKYRELLNQNKVERSSNTGFIEMIRPFLSFYIQLPEYAKQTNKLTKEVLNLRKAIADSIDPEKTFFEDFPSAMGYSLKELDESPQKLERFFVELRQSITDIRSSFSGLVQRFEEFVLEEIVGGNSILEFVDWKKVIQDRFIGLKSYIISPHLRVFLQRLNSNLDDKITFLSSLSHAIIGKQLEDINDEEEVVLFVKFKEWIHELENFTEIENKVTNEYVHDAVKIEITSLKEGLNKQVLSIPKSKQKEVERKKAEFIQYLTNDREMNIFILAKLLKDQMD
ncbi:hypothetical protein HX021_19785 [Sphingobacterium sp. N143]|uniref:hypothetical protein n=1 Tax=Sphingobacterium sp. N143 TaxID=2746727 RepID=UPI002575320C|nr:hypothetical protein [Sphingobacterium sp. N143]MDM1296533.1 hypothetical protein [Sphingobacterium sp. N143]